MPVLSLKLCSAARQWVGSPVGARCAALEQANTADYGSGCIYTFASRVSWHAYSSLAHTRSSAKWFKTGVVDSAA